MKKVKLFFAFAFIASAAIAQPYGELFYVHQGAITSSGHECLNIATNPGFIIGSYWPNNTQNFAIDRTDVGGTSTGAPWEFHSDYAITGDASCGTTAATDCAGISVIEENVAGGANYAVAGSFSGGVFFSMLNGAGAPVGGSAIFLNFPAGTVSWSKPKLIASPFNANEYFIAGSYYIAGAPWYMYLLRVDNIGTIIGNQVYQEAGANISLEVTDIVASPFSNYSGNEVAVVGMASDFTGTSGFAMQGFFATFDTGTMGNTSLTFWGQPWSSSGTDFFSCMTVANNTGYGGGYAIGGYSSLTLNSGNLWTCILDPAGTTMFTSYIQTTSNIPAKVIKGIVERTTTYGQSSYFGVVQATGPANDVMVVKMDWDMQAYPGWAYSTNPIEWVSEFHYASPSGAPALGEAITFDDFGTPNDQGIHVYGTDNLPAFGNIFFTEAAFNGEDGCGTTMKHSSFPGPNNGTGGGISNITSLSPCTNFGLTQTNNLTYNWVCGSGAAFPANGSNNRPAGATAIGQNKADASVFSLYPNPTNSQINLNYYVADNGKATIKIYNNLGELVKDLSTSAPQGAGQQTLNVDLGKLDIASGIYFIKANVNGVEYKEKVVYNKQ